MRQQFSKNLYSRHSTNSRRKNQNKFQHFSKRRPFRKFIPRPHYSPEVAKLRRELYAWSGQKKFSDSYRSRPKNYFFRRRQTKVFHKHRRAWPRHQKRRFRPVYRGGRMKSRRFGKKKFFKRKFQWRKWKKPFWKRKSYKIIKLYNLVIKNAFKAFNNHRLKLDVKRYEDPQWLQWQKLKNKKKKILPWYQNQWYDYYRRNKTKFWFRNKIALRLVWMNRYSCWSHRKAFHFVWRARRRTPSLLRFWQKFEFTLDRYIIWWQFANQFTQGNIFYARWLIQNGYVYVNYLPVVKYRYRIQLGDCILFLTQLVPRTTYFVSRLLNPYKTKFRRSYRLRYIRRIYKKSYTKRFEFFLKKYKVLKLLNNKYLPYFIQFYYFIERSYKYHIFVNLQTITWFVLLFSTLGKFIERVNFHFLNSFVNRRYG